MINENDQNNGLLRKLPPFSKEFSKKNRHHKYSNFLKEVNFFYRLGRQNDFGQK
jgi:hypothetical protein